ncbi:MAG: hypothetical protein WA383_11120 [Terriglobales bacterium]
MAFDSGFQKKLQIFLVAALVIAGGARGVHRVRAARGYEGGGSA